MTPVQRVAVAGGNGNLGPVIIGELLANNLHVSLLSRKGSTSTDTLKNRGYVGVVEVDYQDLDGLAKALEGVDVVVSTIGNAGLDTQVRLVDAAVAAGVKRFLPSEFGANPEQEKNKQLPFYMTKSGILDHLKKKAAENPGFSYTTITPHIFFDWALRQGS
ncbi:hypothetical protein ACJ41O_005956 [Fusarium nematophilum]